MNSFLRRLAPVWTPHPGQLEFLESVAKIKVLACGRRWGKTDACAAQVVAALQGEEPTRHLILAPTLDQATILFDRILELLTAYEGASNPPLREGWEGEQAPPKRTRKKATESSAVSSANPAGSAKGAKKTAIAESVAIPPAGIGVTARKATKQDDATPKERKPRAPRKPKDPNAPKPVKRIRRTPYPSLTYNGHRVVARSGHVGRSLRGNEATHIIIDEAAFVPEELVSEVAMPMLATTEGSLTLISTPNGHNHFWRFFLMGTRNEHGIWSRSAPSKENTLVSQTFLDIQRELISPRAFAIEYEAEFLASEGAVFRQEAVESCTIPKLPEGLRGDCAIGVDWGRRQDSTAVVVLCGDRDLAYVVESATFLGDGWPKMIAKVKEIAERYPNAPILCDGTALQDAISSDLREAMPKRLVEEFEFTRPSKRKLLDNLQRSFEGAKLRFEPDPNLLRELEHFEFRPDGKIGAKSGYHDDLVIALALAAWKLPHAYKCRVQVLGPRAYAS